MNQPVEIRPAVAAFTAQMAQRMETRLRRHDPTRGPAGWENDDPNDLFAHLLEEVCEVAALLGYSESRLTDEISRAFTQLPPEAFLFMGSADPVEEEATDVAAMAMMVAAAFRRQEGGG